MLNIVLIVHFRRESRTVDVSRETFEVSQEVSIEKAPVAQAHKHYRWRDPLTDEIMYYGITSKDDVAQRFQEDARRALSIVTRYRKLAELNEQGLAPIVEVYDFSANLKEARRKEKEAIRGGIARGEPLLNSENHKTMTKFMMRTQVVNLLTSPEV